MQYKKIITIGLNVILGIFLVIGIIVGISLLPIKNNFKILTVMSGSMEPKIKTGELIIVSPKADYNIGEIISFKVRGSDNKETTITHRIFEKNIIRDQATYVTKGDANNTPDNNKIAKDQIIGRFIFGVKYVGYLIAYVKTPLGLIIIIVIPATIIIYEEAKKIKTEVKSIIGKHRAKKSNAKKTDSKKSSKNSDNSETTKLKTTNYKLVKGGGKHDHKVNKDN